MRSAPAPVASRSPSDSTVTAPRILPPRFTPPTDRPVVAVFGSSTTTPSDPAWAVAVELGQRLARAGFAGMNGGYAGSMEAVSEGAARGGGPGIGGATRLFNFPPADQHVAQP